MVRSPQPQVEEIERTIRARDARIQEVKENMNNVEDVVFRGFCRDIGVANIRSAHTLPRLTLIRWHYTSADAIVPSAGSTRSASCARSRNAPRNVWSSKRRWTASLPIWSSSALATRRVSDDVPPYKLRFVHIKRTRNNNLIGHL